MRFMVEMRNVAPTDSLRTSLESMGARIVEGSRPFPIRGAPGTPGSTCFAVELDNWSMARAIEDLPAVERLILTSLR